MKGEWLRKPSAGTTVVFVHGILSSGETCWKHGNGASWPRLLQEESELAALGIYLFTYQTSVFSGTYNLSDVVDSLVELLRLDEVLASPKIIFVCHSMGGIVVRKFLVKRTDLVERKIDIGLFLVASPSLGSSYANWLSPLAQFLGHTQADALRFTQGNVWLNELDKDFLTLKEANRLTLKGKELIEDKFVILHRLWRKQAVEPFSGARYFGEPYKVPLSDHFSIAKPENAQAVQHRLLCRFIKDNFALSPQNPPEISNPVATAPGTIPSALKPSESSGNISGTTAQSGAGNIALQGIKDSNVTLNVIQSPAPSSPTTTPGTVSGAVATGSTTLSDQRALELAYLDRLQDEERLNQEKQAKLYTPLSGKAQKHRPTLCAAYERRSAREGEPPPPKPGENAIEEIQEMRQAALLGEPGSGKTTTLWLLAVNLLEAARQNPAAPIPLLIRLGRWTEAEQTLLAFIAEQLGELGAHLETLLPTKRAALLLDGLNELPVSQRESKYPKVEKLITAHKDLLAVVSCRELDYTIKLKFDTINILPLDPLRIREFVVRDLGEEKGEQMFWTLAGEAMRATYERFMQQFSGKLPDPETTFWNEAQLPAGVYWGWSDEDYKNNHWERWLEQRKTPTSLMLMAQNPYLLSMLDAEFEEAGKLPSNRGDLFRAFVNRLLKRERDFLTEEVEREALQGEHDALTDKLIELAFAMQNRRNKGAESDAWTALPKAAARDVLTERQLYLARNASLLSGDEQVRFSHQLLQEYFAAKFMDIKYHAGELQAEKLWPRERWWERTNWEEAAVLWAGLYTADCSEIIQWLAGANPEVAAQCIVRSGSVTPPETREQLRKLWEPRLIDLRGETNPLARAAVGRALGLIGDTRPGVGVKPAANGVYLPDIDWLEIPGGEFQLGYVSYTGAFASEKISLPTFYISRYPITYAQFQTFLDDPTGYADPYWFARLAASEAQRRMQEQTWRYYDHYYTNHPRETVNWYQAIAFCRWLSWRIFRNDNWDNLDGEAVRLPTEFEWEKAARGKDRRRYPYGSRFDKARGNLSETGIRQTSAVGIFPNGASSFGVQEMSGNVWELCLSNYEKPMLEAMEENLQNDEHRVIKGGAWDYSQFGARTDSRSHIQPSFCTGFLGFRVCCSARPLS